ncbi:hypothetical protein BCY91_12970 [Pelobium manganitolerans]|uniref:Uncharacterized protein n=1 Tax=Pelobium manganitolerans TaxID=1842495 RepID=A0A419SAQ2_9SPHI|nr:hypothetical protein BCY91_12970 [Pelobium manganitolerans]
MLGYSIGVTDLLVVLQICWRQYKMLIINTTMKERFKETGKLGGTRGLPAFFLLKTAGVKCWGTV